MLRRAPDGHLYLNDGGRYLLLEEGGNKFRRAEVDYGEGHAPQFCRTCEFSDHQKPKPHCKYVRDIARDGWCKLWTKD